MKEYFSAENKKKHIKNNLEIGYALNQLIMTRLKREKLMIHNQFLREVYDNFDYLPEKFKKRFIIYVDNKLDQSSPLGQELRKELDEILRKKQNDDIELADYEIIEDNKQNNGNNV